MRPFFTAALILILSTLSLRADPVERSYIGYGRLIVNDSLGDFRDRWRTGSVAASHVWGPDWTGALPGRPFDILEFRVLAEVIYPLSYNAPRAGDRPYAAAWSFGMHTHFQRGGWDLATGADLVITGPQTGLPDFARALHEVLSLPKPSRAVLAGQVPNGFHAAAVVEAGRDLSLGGATLRPFVELRAGVETLARVGFDLTIGPAGQGELLVRDPVTGHRYRTITGDATGFSFVAGADIARVTDSLYLPASTNTLTDSRHRLRAGLHWQGEKWQGFYGLTWLGPEFVGQQSGQLVGAVRIKFTF